MSELKRYEPSCDDVTIGSMDEELEGDYVEYADYARLKAAADVAVKALKAAELDCRGYDAVHGWLEQATAALDAYQEATR